MEEYPPFVGPGVCKNLRLLLDGIKFNSTGEKLRSSFQQDEIPNIKKQHLERVLVKKGMGFRNGESLSIENRSWGVSLSN